MAADVIVTSHGSITQFTLLTDAALAWVEENVATEGWQWMGSALNVEWRYASDLIQGMIDAGLEIET